MPRMKITTIEPPKRFGIVYHADRDTLRRALAERVDPGRPMANAWVNGYGSIHCDVWATPGQMQAWFAEDRELRFYIGKEDVSPSRKS